MRRVAAVGVFALVAMSTVTVASGDYGKYLPPDQAFELEAKAVPNGVILEWHIADNYYLYRDKIKVVATNGTVGKTCLPPGKVKMDPYFGRTEVYYHVVRVYVPHEQTTSGGQLALAVTYQGCAEAGLCYPPIVKHLRVQLDRIAPQTKERNEACKSGKVGSP